MRVQELKIERGYYGDKPLAGTITLVDANNAELKIPLTPGAISKLLACISKEVVSTLQHVASQAPRALQEAQDEGVLLEHDGEV